MFDNLNSKQKKIIIIIGIIVIIGVLYFIYNGNEETEFDEEDILIENKNEEVEEKADEEIEEDEEIVVHITGGVKIPGIIRLKQGSRIEDAIELAGGLTEEADISDVNLAYVLDDGVKIIIPTSQDIEEKEIISEENGENIIEKEGSTKSNSTEKTININKASQEDFTKLPGIGEELALRIVEYRTEKGKFSKIEDIKNVSGIGDSKYEKIKDLISIK